MSLVLVLNSGSSSLKYQLFSVDAGGASQPLTSLAAGLIERIGEPIGALLHTRRVAGEEVRTRTELRIADHQAGFAVMLEAFAASGMAIEPDNLRAVGHRVVHGGAEFFAPTVVDDAVLERISALSVLAPLHNPANVDGIRAAMRVFAGVPQVAVFDTAFHQSIPPAAYTVAIDQTLARRHAIRTFGFHGTSHEYVSRVAAEHLGRPVAELRQVVLHLGNGASMCAVAAGRSVATSMGMTPLQGLVMGTRSGDIDPSALLTLLRSGELDVDELDALLNKSSGLLGLGGSSDMRDLEAAAAAGDAGAELAIDVYVHRIRHYLGSYLVQLGGADTLVFTAGVGENSETIRARVLAGMEWLGVELDPELNASRADAGPRVVSRAGAAITVLVVPTDEERAIATQSLAAVRLVR